MVPSPAQRERLDVESPDERNARLGTLLSSIAQTTPSPSSPSKFSPGTLNGGPSRPFAMPQSDVLARAMAFLPLMQASNEELLARAALDPDAVNVEKPGTTDEKVIAMDLGLGVFEAPSDLNGDLGPVVDTAPPSTLNTDDSGSESDEDMVPGQQAEEEEADESSKSESSSSSESETSDDSREKHVNE